MDRKLVETAGSDEWWLARLGKKLSTQASRVNEADLWLTGRPPLPVPDNDKPGFERLQRIANVNPAEMIVEARLHRMRLMGASTKVDNSANGDDVVAALFREEDLKRKFHELFRFTLGHGRGYVLLTANGGVRVLDGAHATIIRDAGGNTVAGLSIYRDEVNQRDVLALVREGYTRYAYRNETYSFLPSISESWFFDADVWEWGELVQNGSSDIPIYELTPPGELSLIDRHKSTLMRINHGVLQRMILIAIQAFKQRALKNVPTDEETGEAPDLDGGFESSPDALWVLPEGVEIWESSQADLTPVLTAVKHDLQYLAVTSKTPLYMISPDDANGSAEGASAQRETLIFDIETLIDAFEGTVKNVLAHALRIRKEDERADISALKLLWANPRRSSPVERAQAALTAKNAGIPFRVMLEDFAELSPEQIEAAVQQRTDDAFLNTVLTTSQSGATS